MSEEDEGRAEQDDANGKETNRSAPDQFFLGNIPWLLTLSLLALVVAKLLMVARFNTTTALALVNNSSIVTISLGALVSGLPLLLYAVWVALFQLCGTTRKATFARRVLTVPLLFVAILLTLFGSWLFLLTVALSLDALFEGPIFRSVDRRLEAKLTWSPSTHELANQARERLATLQANAQGKATAERLDRLKMLPPDEQMPELLAIQKTIEEGQQQFAEDSEFLDKAVADIEAENKRVETNTSRIRRWTSRLLYANLILAVILAMMPFFDGRPWLPEERIVLADGSTHIGYVVQESEGSIVFMADEDRSIDRFAESDVSARFVCIAKKPRTSWLASVARPPAALFAGDGPHYPLCSPPQPSPSPSPSPPPSPTPS